MNHRGASHHRDLRIVGRTIGRQENKQRGIRLVQASCVSLICLATKLSALILSALESSGLSSKCLSSVLAGVGLALACLSSLIDLSIAELRMRLRFMIVFPL